MRTCLLLLGALAACLLISCCNAAAGGPCDSSCTDKLNCCADQLIGNTCFNTTVSDCTSNRQICAKGLALCSFTCYDGGLYDCIGTRLCPKGLQLCGIDQCFNTSVYACIAGSQVLRTAGASECAGIGYNTQVNECVNGTIGPIRPSTPCGPNQALCGSYCYDPQLYSCAASGNLTSLPGFCGQGEVWCSIKCYNPTLYTCQNGQLINYAVGSACPSGQTACGQVCYDPSLNLVCTAQLVICPSGMGVCNNTCFNTTRYDCVSNGIVMHPGYCPTGLALCGERCYNTSSYYCYRDLLSPIGVTGCQTSPCMSADSCCSDDYNGTLCYGDSFYECEKNTFGSKLCGKGLQLCDDQCYDPSIYSCFNNDILCPAGLSYCTSNNRTGCYDKSTYTCLASSTLCPVGGAQCGGACINIDKYICGPNNATIQFVVCPKGQLNCAGTCYVAGGKLQCINRTLVEVTNATCPDGNCNGTCFLTSRAYCIEGQVVNKPTCDDPEVACFLSCYDPSTYECSDDTVIVLCPTGFNRCNATCFNGDTQYCMNGKVMNQTCAYLGLEDCGAQCYNPSTNSCREGVVAPKCGAGLTECGKTSCFNPLTQECPNGQVLPICTGGESRCGTTCYDPKLYHCSSDNTVQPNSASLPTVSLSLIFLLIICIIV